MALEVLFVNLLKNSETNIDSKFSAHDVTVELGTVLAKLSTGCFVGKLEPVKLNVTTVYMYTSVYMHRTTCIKPGSQYGCCICSGHRHIVNQALGATTLLTTKLESYNLTINANVSLCGWLSRDFTQE